jgi:hypothetical protein
MGFGIIPPVSELMGGILYVLIGLREFMIGCWWWWFEEKEEREERDETEDEEEVESGGGVEV